MPRKQMEEEHDFNEDFGKFNIGLEEEEHEGELEEADDEEEKELDFGSDNYSRLAGFSDDDE